MRPESIFKFGIVASLALSLQACSVLQPGRSLGRELDDVNASIALKSSMLRSEGYVLGGIDVEVTEGLALLTGTAPRVADRLHAECLAWQVPQIRDVSNEVDIGGNRGLGSATRDSVITQQIRGRLTSDSEVNGRNFNIETYDGIVYLLGYARNENERERASRHASLVDDVERVIVMVRVAGEEVSLPSRGERINQFCSIQGLDAEDYAPAPEGYTPIEPQPLGLPPVQEDIEPHSDVPATGSSEPTLPDAQSELPF